MHRGCNCFILATRWSHQLTVFSSLVLVQSVFQAFLWEKNAPFLLPNVSETNRRVIFVQKKKKKNVFFITIIGLFIQIKSELQIVYLFKCICKYLRCLCLFLLFQASKSGMLKPSFRWEMSACKDLYHKHSPSIHYSCREIGVNEI